MKTTPNNFKRGKPGVRKQISKKPERFSQDTGDEPKKTDRNKLRLNEYHQKIFKRKPSFKKQIRDIQRLVNKKTIPDEAKDTKETKIRELKKKARESRKKRFLVAQNQGKYKKIKFFEETKLKRKLKQVTKKIEQFGTNTEIEETLEQLEAEKKKIIDDLDYIRFYPPEKKYVALFPNAGEEDEETTKKTQAMREIIKKRMERQTDNVKRHLEKLSKEVEGKERKLDTFFEVEENQEAKKTSKKKIVDKRGRIININGDEEEDQE